MHRLFASALFLTDADYAYLATQITYGVCIYRCAQGVQKVIAFGRRALDPPVVAICMLISSKTASILIAGGGAGESKTIPSTSRDGSAARRLAEK
jgi:hypothetical protein